MKMSIHRQMIMNRVMAKLIDEFLSQQTQDEFFSPKGLEQLIKAGRKARKETRRGGQAAQSKPNQEV
jgi:hypothetical protein